MIDTIISVGIVGLAMVAPLLGIVLLPSASRKSSFTAEELEKM